jgi:hypothetical protein
VVAVGGAGAGAPVPLPLGPLAFELVVDGIPIAELGPGTRLRVGRATTLELGAAGGRPGEACGGVREVGAGASVPARVVEPGAVRPDDSVRLEAVRVPVGDCLDLHWFRPDETAEIVAAYLAEAHAAGLGEVRIVHGRGRGVQRAIVQRALMALPEVIGFADAPPDRGGWGATIVRLATAGDPSRNGPGRGRSGPGPDGP